MSAIDYGVNFNLNVNAEAALQTVNKFKTAVASLAKTKNNPLQEQLRQAESLNNMLASLSRKPVNLDTSAASRKLDLLNKQAKALTRHLNSINQRALSLGFGGGVKQSTPIQNLRWAANLNRNIDTIANKLGSVATNAPQARLSFQTRPAMMQLNTVMQRLISVRRMAQNIPVTTISTQLPGVSSPISRKNLKRVANLNRNVDTIANKLGDNTSNAIGGRLSFQTRPAMMQLNTVMQRLISVRRMAQNIPVTFTQGTIPGVTAPMSRKNLRRMAEMRQTLMNMGTPGDGAAPRQSKLSTNSGGGYSPKQIWEAKPKNLGYKLLGPSPLTNNGGMAVSMLKGMGIGYGIAGIGQLASNIIQESAQYDNLMKTVENILKSHDMSSDFNRKFEQMTATIRNVGMETKYKTTEVADAAKFLAMAGLDVEAINKAMRPVADIALIGDTDLGQTADMVTNVMTAYNLQPGQMRKAADIMTNTFTMSNTTLTDIAEAYKYSASLLSASDVDFGESAAAIGVLGDAGIKGSQAGTTLRTILANILNPTKKQKKAWDSIGVSTDGKSLVQIFQELNAKDLDAGKFYQLFHKTAAAGAVALASHVDKWNEIISENLLSDGMSSKLADEKKNTIQGLWAQLTSVFTDDGIQAFGGIQEPIRQAMKGAIEFLKSDEAKSKFMAFFAHLKEFGKILKEVTGWFYWIYEKAWSIIKPLAKIQLYLWPITKGFRMLTTGSNVAKWFMSAASSITLFTGRLLGASKANKIFAASAVKSSNISASSMAMSGGVYGKFIHSYAKKTPNEQTLKSFKDSKAWKQLQVERERTAEMLQANRNNASLGVAPLYSKQEIEEQRKIQMGASRKAVRTLAWKNAWADRKNIAKNALNSGVMRNGVGMAAMAGGTYQLTRDDGVWQDSVSGGLYSVAGLTAMSGSYLAAAAFAGLGVIFQVAGAVSRAQKAMQDVYNFAAAHTLNNGILSGSEDNLMRQLEIIHGKNVDVNNLIRERIRLKKEELGLGNADGPKNMVGAVNAELEKQDFFAAYRTPGMVANRIVEAYNANKKMFGPSTELKVKNDRGIAFMVNGVETGYYATPSNDLGDAQHAAANEYAAIRSYFTSGAYDALVKDFSTNVSRRYAKKYTATQWMQFYNDFEQKHNPSLMKGLIGVGQMSQDDVNSDNWDDERTMLSKQLHIVRWNMLKALFDSCKKISLKYAETLNGGNVTNGEMVDILSDFNPALAPMLRKEGRNGLITRANFLSNWGGVLGEFGYKGGEFIEQNGFTAEDNAENALTKAAQIRQAVEVIGLQNTESGQKMLQFAGLLESLSNLFLGNVKKAIGSYDGEIQKIGQYEFRWDAATKQWLVVTNGAQQFLQELLTTCGAFANMEGAQQIYNMAQKNLIDLKKEMGAAAFDKALKDVTEGPKAAPKFYNPNDKHKYVPSYMNVNGKKVNILPSVNQYLSGLVGGKAGNPQKKVNGLDGGDDDNGLNINTDDYKSRYKNNAAAPKQVIVNIDSLLTVEHVDMADPKKAETVYNLKKDLSQALIDVVHEFDATWHG